MSRFSRGVSTTDGASKWRWTGPGPGRLGLPAAPCGLASRQRRCRRRPHDRDPRQTATQPDPSCPDLPCQAVGSVTGFQVNNGQTKLPFRRPQRRHDQGLDADPGPADQQPAHLLQRLLRHAAAGAPGDPPPRPRHRSRPATTCAARARSRSSRPTSGRRSSSAPTSRSKRATSSASTVPTWAPAFAQDLPANNVWRASREAGHLQERDRHPPRRTAGKSRHPQRPTAANTPPPACSTRPRS